MDASKNPPICVDCAHYGVLSCERSRRPAGIDPVYGYPRFKGPLRIANQERASRLPWLCGKRGRFFVPIKAVR